MDEALTPEEAIVVSEAVINVLRGMRLSSNPKIGAVAAAREAKELDYLEKIRRQTRRRSRGIPAANRS